MRKWPFVLGGVVLVTGFVVALVAQCPDGRPRDTRIEDGMALAEVEAILGKPDSTGWVRIGTVDPQTGRARGDWRKLVTMTWRGTDYDFDIWLETDGTVESRHYREPTGRVPLGTRQPSLRERLAAWFCR
jgi:hypothetical protein